MGESRRLVPFARHRFVPALCVSVHLWALGQHVRAERLPSIEHNPLTCLPNDAFAQVAALIHPDEEIRTARVYFRSDTYPDFYFVEMDPFEGGFRAFLPIPAGETHRVIYYIEAVDLEFNSSRTEEHDPEVASQGECRRRDPLLAVFPGDSPSLIVGALTSGAAAMPPGFQVVGITGFVGLVGATGGGSGAAIAAVGGVAGAGATVGLVKARGGGQTDTASTVPTTTSNLPATSTSMTFTTTSTSPSTTTSTSPGTTTSISTATSTTTPASVSACFTAVDSDGASGCSVMFDASCSAGNIISYTWWFADNPPLETTTDLATVTHDWSLDPACGTPFTRLVRLVVTGADGSTAETRANIDPTSPGLEVRRMTADWIQTSFVSHLVSPGSSERLAGQVILNQSRVDLTDDSTPFRHDLRGRAGKNTVEAVIVSGNDREIFWRFDFSASERFVAGSIQVDGGQVLSRDGRSVVFRMTGARGERVRWSFRLR